MTEVEGEVAALDRILTRLALTEEHQLEALLNKLLPALLEKLGTPHEPIRKKTLELLQHINKRSKSLPTLKLPLPALLQQLQSGGHPLVRNFALVYVEQGFERASDEERFACLPLLAQGIAARPEQQRDMLLRLIVQSLESLARGSVSFNSNAEDADLRARCAGFLENEPDRATLATHFLELMLYQPLTERKAAADPMQQFIAMQRGPVPVPVGGAAVLLTGAPGAGDAAAPAPPPPVAPGLSAKMMRTLEAKGKPTLDQLAVKKQGILNFSVKVGLSPQFCVLLYTVAAADPSDAVSRRGEELMKRRLALDTAKPLADLEDPALIRKTFELLLGAPATDPDAARTPVGPILAPRLFALTTKSRHAASSFPANLSAVSRWLAHPKSNLRAQQAAMEFAIAVFRHGDGAIFSRDVLGSVLRTLLCQLASVDDGHAVLQPGQEDALRDEILTRAAEGATSQSAANIRGFSYQAIGLLAEKSPNNFATLPVVASGFLPELLFAALPREAPTVRPQLQETLRQLALALGFKGRGAGRRLGTGDEMEVDELPSASAADLTESGQLARLLSEGIASPSDAVRLAAAQWANAILPPDSALGRYLSILAAGDARTDVKEEGSRGADPEKILEALTKNHKAGGAPVPEAARALLRALLGMLAGKHPEIAGAADLEAPLALKPRSFTAAIELSLALWHAATSSASSAAGESEDDETFDRLCSLLDHAVGKLAPKEVIGGAASAYLSLLQQPGDRARFVRRYAHMLSWLRVAGLSHASVPVRHAFARIIGAAASGSALDAPEVASLLQTLAHDIAATEGGTAAAGASKVRYESMDGSVLALGYILGCRQAANESEAVIKSAAWAALASAVAWSQTGPGKDVQLQCSAVEALSAALCSQALVEAADASVLAALEGAVAKATALAVPADVGDVDRASVLRGLRAAGLLGAAARRRGGEPGDKACTSLLEAVFKAAASKRSDLEVLLAAADALSCILGFLSVSTLQVLLNDESSLADLLARLANLKPSGPGSSHSPVAAEAPLPADAPRLAKVIDEDLTSLCGSADSDKRRGGCVLLHAVVASNGRGAIEVVGSRLSAIQSIFSSLLFEQNDVTQQYASTGLTAVYALGDAATREKLVASLTAMLRGEGAQAQGQLKISGDTKLFEEGALGNVPGGGGRLTTYRELCGLANDLNKPDLIYRLMDLAHHSAQIRSRAGAATGLASILRLTGGEDGAAAAESIKLKKDLEPMLKVMVPKIYRGLYDPDPKCAEGMMNVWRSLVDDPSIALTEHFGPVVDALLKDMTDRLWRHREAGCAALSDLLQGRTWPEVKPHLGKIWGITFRAVDDVKESVRKAALILAKTLRSLTVKLTDVKNGASPREASEVIAELLPLLLTAGIPSPVAEVKAIAVYLIGTIVRNGSSEALRPHLLELVPTLIECLSGTEDARLNYVEQHAPAIGMSRESIQSARVAASRSHPLGEALDTCARLVEDDAVVELVPRLAAVIKRGVGLTTRVGAARFVGQLCLRVGPALRAPAPQLIKALLESMRLDASPAVRKANAAALAALFKFASPSRLDKTLDDLTERVTAGADARDDRLVLGLVLEETVKNAPDAFASLQARALPLVFLFRQDKEDADLCALYGAIWENAAPSEATTLALLSQEVLAVLLGPDGLASSSWARKRMAARALQQIAVKGAASAPIRDRAGDVVRALLGELAAPRHWEGKDTVLAALGQAAESFGAHMDPTTAANVLEGLVAATARRKKEWIAAALAAGRQAAKGLEGARVLTALWPVLQEALRAPPAASSADKEKDAKAAAGGSKREEGTPPPTEDKEKKAAPPLPESLAVLETALDRVASAAGAAAPLQLAAEMAGDLKTVLERNLPWSVRVAALQCLAKVPLKGLDASTVGELVPAVVIALDDSKISQVREKGLAAIKALLSSQGPGLAAEAKASLKQRLTEGMVRETDMGLKDEFADILRKL